MSALNSARRIFSYGVILGNLAGTSESVGSLLITAVALLTVTFNPNLLCGEINIMVVLRQQ